MNQEKTTPQPQLRKLSPDERLDTIQQWAVLSEEEKTRLITGGINNKQADKMVENAIGTLALPLGIATNFLINKKDYLIPMVIEEPSVIAAASNAAKLFRTSGGFMTSSDSPIMIGQIQILDVKNQEQAAENILKEKPKLLEEANKTSSITKRGGGAQDIQIRKINDMMIIHLLFDTRDAMGANAVNTAVEHLAPYLEKLTGGRANLKILSNLSDQRKARAEGIIPAEALAREDITGQEAIKAILEAALFAEIDPYRAATHNKGIMNGIDAVAVATGNDWRAIEAGAHAYAARNGQYTSLTHWWQDENGNLKGSIELPLAVGIIGGATQVHPTAQIALKILGVKTAQELAEVIAAVGLAQNLAAIRALATEGIQHGHMRMHARQLAAAAGAPDDLIISIAQTMIEEKNIRLERAKELVKISQQGN